MTRTKTETSKAAVNLGSRKLGSNGKWYVMTIAGWRLESAWSNKKGGSR